MTQNSPSDFAPIIHALESLLVQVRTMAGLVDEPRNAPNVSERIDRRECLACGRLVPDGESYVRGLGSECYGTTMRHIREGKKVESELIHEGKLAVRGKPGKPATIDMQIDARLAKRQHELEPRIRPKKRAKPDRKKRE